MRTGDPRPEPRRGVTLIEMLVTLALLLLVMSIIVSIFRVATESVSRSRTLTMLDQSLRRIDTMLRQDFDGITVHMTPPADATKQEGYFEYIENEFADAQGEDTDDILAFTVNAPEGHPFTGRIMLPVQNSGVISYIQTMVTSDFAEVIYFLRNGNLYRRVLLVVPDRKGSLTLGPNNGGGYTLNLGGQAFNVSWQGANDISARPPEYYAGATSYVPVPNSLGDLTERPNRYVHPRFTNDYNFDGVPDDSNLDGIPDYYPTLYPGNPYVNDGNWPNGRTVTRDTFAFPFIYPYAFSKPYPNNGPVWPPIDNTYYGAIHYMGPGYGGGSFTVNHAPLDLGESQMPNPSPPPATISVPVPSGTNQLQTWWGVPTRRETMSANWTDPITQLNTNSQQSLGLSWVNGPNWLPQLSPLPPFSDGVGSNTYFMTPGYVVEEDLILAGVRSFDVKAFDPYAGFFNLQAGYYDLGYANLGTSVVFPQYLQSFGHEGRMPPISNDNRFDAQYPIFPIGDDNTGVVRMRRTFDTWSTTYTHAPDVGINPLLGFPPIDPNGNPLRPVYPSYPAPYPIPLRGVRVQIRAVDPRNQRVKTLTIIQDFSDKL